MGNDRKKRRQQSHHTTEELDLIKEKVMERFEGGRAQRERAQHERAERADVVSFLARASRDAPPPAGGSPPPFMAKQILLSLPHSNQSLISVLVR